jgi:hypothetical protein
MRSALFAALALVVSTPAFAANPVDESSSTQRDVQAMADKLNNPQMQTAIASSLGAMLGALLDIRVDGIAKALEPMNHGKKIKLHGKTLREMAEREDPKFESKMQNGTRAAVGSMGALASALAVMVPQLEQAARKMGDALPNTN